MEKFFYQVVVVLYQEQLYGQYIKDVGLHGAVSLVPWEIEFPRNPDKFYGPSNNNNEKQSVDPRKSLLLNIIAGIVELINRGFAFFLD